MTREQIIERETRLARPVGLATAAILPLFLIASGLDPVAGPVPLSGVETERYRALHEHASGVIGAAVLRGAALALIAVPLWYLFRAAQARNPRVNGPMIGFVFLGPLLFAVQGIISAVGQTQVASDFVAQIGPGGDLYTLLDDLKDDSTLFAVGQNLIFPAILGLGVAMVYVPLQAMRVGLLTKPFAILGMVFAVSTILLAAGLALLALAFWFGWLGMLILGRTPKGRPPAWAAGEAVPWPRAGEKAVAQERSEPAVVEGDATEAFGSGEADSPKDQSARRERARKKKRKRRQ